MTTLGAIGNDEEISVFKEARLELNATDIKALGSQNIAAAPGANLAHEILAVDYVLSSGTAYATTTTLKVGGTGVGSSSEWDIDISGTGGRHVAAKRNSTGLDQLTANNAITVDTGGGGSPTTGTGKLIIVVLYRTVSTVNSA